jgi:hypothetical protein
MHPLLAWDFFGVDVPIPLPALLGMSALIAAALLYVTHGKSSEKQSSESRRPSKEPKQ